MCSSCSSGTSRIRACASYEAHRRCRVPPILSPPRPRSSHRHAPTCFPIAIPPAFFPSCDLVYPRLLAPPRAAGLHPSHLLSSHLVPLPAARVRLGRYDLSYIMHNPFLDRRIDVAHEAIGAGLRQLSIDLMVPKLPPTIVPPAKRNARVRRRKDDMQDGEDTTSVGRTPVKERLAGMSGGVERGERREKRPGQQRVKRDLRV